VDTKIKMPDITHSGLYHDIRGQLFLVTQGLVGYTLVDRKKILFRLFVSQFNLDRTTAVAARIRYTGADIPDSRILFSTSDLLKENLSPNGPNVGVVLQGNIFPSASLRYLVEFHLLAGELDYATTVITDLKFERSGRLRVLPKTLESITRTAPWGNKIESNLYWLRDLVYSMERLGAMLPVSDGVFLGSNPSPTKGLAWITGEKIDAWPAVCPSGNPPSRPDVEFPSFLVCPSDEMNEFIIQEAKDLNSQGIRVHVTVAWRPRDPMRFPPPGGEDIGGQAPFGVNPAPESRLGTVCGGNLEGVETTAPIMAQEIAHNFGCVSRDSPHVDADHHSRDLQLIDPYAFDFFRLRPYSAAPPGPQGSFIGDVMSTAVRQGSDLTLYSAYDWEHLRRRLVQLPIPLTNSDEKESDKKLVEEVQTAFVGVEKIEVEHPESTLYSKPGFEWHWTHIGFQPLIEGKTKRNRPGLALSAESVLYALRELGIKEVYAPMEGKPLGFVVSPERINSIRCEIK
jgi:hypothetical protein